MLSLDVVSDKDEVINLRCGAGQEQVDHLRDRPFNFSGVRLSYGV